MDLPIMKSRACLALAEETEAARSAFYGLLPRFPDQDFQSGNPETEDNLRGIVCHTTASFRGYASWMRRVLGRLDPEVEKPEKAAFLSRVRSLRSADEFEAVSREAASYYYDTLAQIDGNELEREFKSNWGETLTVELMMEHALVHFLRHRRQLQILLGDRPQQPVRE